MRGAIRDLFDETAYPNGPGHRNVATSVAAAESMKPHFSKQQQTIMDFLRKRGTLGATYDDISEETGIKVPSVCGRMVELVEKGAVKISETTRKTGSGREARVYVPVSQ